MKTTKILCKAKHSHRFAQRGVTLIMVLLILVVVSMLGVGGAQIALMSERGARNDRDQQLAWQAAEAGLIDAENDLIFNSTQKLCAMTASCPTNRPRNGTPLSDYSPMSQVFDGKSKINFPTINGNCSNASDYRGLCASFDTGKPAWLREDFTATSSSASTVAFGTFTGANFETGEVGVQPAQAPRYIIEPIEVRAEKADASKPDPEIVYRVTAMGFGPRPDIQAVVQMLYRI